SPNHFGLPSTKRSAKWPKAILPIDDGGSSSGRTTVSDTVNPGSNPGPPANSHLAPSRREAFLPQRSRSAAARSLCPGVAQRHRAIEHGRSGLRVHQVDNEIAVPFELEMFASPRLLQCWLDLCLHNAPRVRVDVEQEVALAGAGVRDAEQPIVESHLAGLRIRDGHPMHIALDLVLVGAGRAGV